MTITPREIPAGARVLVDANIIVYALVPGGPHHAVCTQLLRRGAFGALTLHLPASVAADVIHRVMVLDVIAQGTVPSSAHAVTYLKWQPAAVQRLTWYRTVLRDPRQARVDILPLGCRDLHASRQERERDGLLTNDSLLVAVMWWERIRHLATNDADFERIGGIIVCVPG